MSRVRANNGLRWLANLTGKQPNNQVASRNFARLSKANSAPSKSKNKTKCSFVNLSGHLGVAIRFCEADLGGLLIAKAAFKKEEEEQQQEERKN